MNLHPPLYTASVPVFLHYLDRIGGMVARAGDAEGLLQVRLAPDMFTLAEQLATAMAFSLRGAYPLAGREAPKGPQGRLDHEGLRERLEATRAALGVLRPGDFAGAEDRVITHRAGFAELTQDGATFLHRFAIPNFLFHTAMAFAILRSNGTAIGKADFDGQHDYPPGFRF